MDHTPVQRISNGWYKYTVEVQVPIGTGCLHSMQVTWKVAVNRPQNYFQRVLALEAWTGGTQVTHCAEAQWKGYVQASAARSHRDHLLGLHWGSAPWLFSHPHSLLPLQHLLFMEEHHLLSNNKMPLTFPKPNLNGNEGIIKTTSFL